MSIRRGFSGRGQGTARHLLVFAGLWVGLVSACLAKPTISIPNIRTAVTGMPTAAGSTETPGTATRAIVTATPAPFLTPTQKPTYDTSRVLTLADGPHLFIDDYLIAYRDRVSRRVTQPQRTLPNPIITGLQDPDGDDNFNFATVALRDPQTGLFRMWYTAYDVQKGQPYSAYITSHDGIQWIRPSTEVSGTRDAPIGDVIDLGSHFADPAERYQAITTRVIKPLGLPSLLVSPNGLTWQPPKQNISSPVAYGEVWRIFQGLGDSGFELLHRWNRPFDWTDSAGIAHHNTAHDPSLVRLFAQSSSPGLHQVTNTQVVFAPDSHDSGETQFYSMSNIIRRGDYYLATLDILRDDLHASGVPATIHSPVLGQQFPVFGTGYTVLAWSRDGQHWFRDRETDPYFSPSAQTDAWDHAVAWVNSIVASGDTVNLYYGGYRYGHKVYFDRQIGLATTYRDRYVGQQAGRTPGILRTPLVSFKAATVTLNADVGNGGQIRFEVLGADGLPVSGFSFDDCAPVNYNSLVAPVMCAKSFATLANLPVKFEFELTNAELFAFNLGSDI